MRIAFIYFGRRGGGPVYSLEIAKKLAKKTELFCLISNQIENLNFWQKDNLPIFPIRTYGNFLGFLFSFFNFKKFLLLRRKIKEFSPDVIFYPFFHPWFVMINLMFPKIPKVFAVHDPVFHKGEKNFILSFLQNRVIKKSKRVIVLSKVFKETIMKKGIKPENIDVIPHGIFDYYHFSQVSPVRPVKVKPETGMPQGSTALFFGRIIAYKGLDILLKAFPLIKKDLPGVRLLIVGPGSLKPHQKTLKELSSFKNDIEIVNKWIKDEEVGDYFAKSDLIICPYLEASQSGVIPIAYMFKLPVVATNVGGLEEQVKHGETGLLVSPNNSEELAGACVEILKDEEKRKQMGENAYNFAMAEWNWQTIGDKVFESLNKL